MSYQWERGMFAVCIQADGYASKENAPRLGKIYTVRGFLRETANIYDALWFYELVNTVAHTGDDTIDGTSGYLAADFRPLHGTDIRKLEEKYPEYVIKTNEVEG